MYGANVKWFLMSPEFYSNREKMYILVKLKEHGWFWFVRRVMQEFINPTTLYGKRLKPASSFVYYLVSKPVNFFCFLTKANTKANATLDFFYDFEVEPITYDFAWALCIANATREVLGLSSLRVVFVPGTQQGLRKESAGYEVAVGVDARNWRVYAILLPVLKLLQCPVSIMFCASREEAMLIRAGANQFVIPEKYNVTFPVPHFSNQAMQYRQKLMALRAEPQALTYIFQWLLYQNVTDKKIIVITLRHYAYTPERNSNIKAWAQFANELDHEEFFVVFVPDTEQALGEIPLELNAFQFFYPACWNLNLRAALYETAYLNLGVNTGPMALCWLNSQCCYITFKINVPNVPQAPIETLIDRGFVPGENPLFAHAFQKWVWEDDNFEVIYREFLLMCENLETGV